MPDNNDKAHIDREIQDNLRRVYRKKVEEDVPDQLLDLIRQLKSTEQNSEGSE